MKRTVMIVLLLVGGISFLCAGGKKDSISSEGANTTRPVWAKSIDEVTGVITVYTTMQETQQEILLSLWKEFYPKCKVEILADSVGALITKIRNDATSGADVIVGGLFAADGNKYHDILQPYTTVLANEQNYLDKLGYYNFIDLQIMCLVVNPDILNKLGVTVNGYKDLLQPQLKGKIILADPAASSSGWRQLQTILAVMGDKFNDTKGWDYIEKLMGASFKTNSSKDVYNLVNDGEYAVGLSYETTPVGIIAQGGAIMKVVYMSEGNTVMPSGAAIVKNAPNLVAAQAMMDLLTSTDFQNKFADYGARGANKNCKINSSLPAHTEFNFTELDYDYLNKNKSKIIEQWNDLWAKVKG